VRGSWNRAAVVSAGALALAGAVAWVPAGAESTVPPCHGADLKGTFKLIPGSAGAGNVSYRLRIRNESEHACFVKGRPKVRLLDSGGDPLPTHTVSGGGTAHKVVLGSDHKAFADARFSPSVPGKGDHQHGQCQPKAFRARIRPRPGGGPFIVPVKPHTPVCERGTLAFKPFQ
jgi:hypothetical protein